MIKIVVAGNKSPLFLVSQYSGVAKSDLFSSNALPPEHPISESITTSLGLWVFHQFDELGIALELPVGLDVSVRGDGEVSFDQLLLELNQRLITIEQQRQALARTGTSAPRTTNG